MDDEKKRCPIGIKEECKYADTCAPNSKLRYVCVSSHKPKRDDTEWH
ncbi:hypothetical protein ACFLQI_02325 [Candidatus Undinarchaeota archaeon]